MVEEDYTSGEKRDHKVTEKIHLRDSHNLRSSLSPTDHIYNLYFEGYSHPEINKDILLDKVRMRVYEEAIRATVNDKKVVDVGSGTGAINIIAAKAGAKIIFAIETSAMIDVAKQPIKDNNVADIVHLI